MTLIRSRTTARMAAAAAAAVALPALVASPASAERTTGFQDIRDYACSPGSTSFGLFTDMGGQLPEYVLGADCLATYGITLGTGTAAVPGGTSTTYSPTVPVARFTMAQFIARQAEVAGLELDTSEPDDGPFPDISGLPQGAIDAINGLANEGIVLGFTDGEFKPGRLITREQMAAFINRLQTAIAEADGDGGAEPFAAPGASATFTDTGNGDVRTLAGAGIVQGVGGGAYNPQGTVSRAQMSAFLTRHLNALLEQTGGLAPIDVDNNGLFSSINVTQTGEAADFVASYVADGLEAGREYRITLVNTDAYETVEFDDGDADGDPADGTTGEIDDVDLVSFESSTARTGAPVAGEPTSGGDVYTADPGDAGAVTGDTTRPGAAVVTVNGQVLAGPAAGRSVLATAANNGTITFGVSGRGADVTLAPFVYQNAPSADYPNYNTLLEVNSRNIADLVDADGDDDDDTDLSNVPVELFGLGEATDFDTPDPVAAPATPGSVSGLVTDDDDDDNSFNVRSSGYQSFTYSYDADDTFTDPSGTAYATLGAFETALSNGDTVQITDYNPDGVSTFQVSADPDDTSPPRVIRSADDDDDVTGNVTAVNEEDNTVEVTGVNTSLIYTYDDNDVFTDPDGNSYADTAAFEAALSVNDTLTVRNYSTTETDISRFDIDVDPDFVEPEPTPRAATDDDDNVSGLVTAVTMSDISGTFTLELASGELVTFAYDGNDSFTDPSGTPYSQASFEEALTTGDTVAVGAYSTTAGDVSEFTIDADPDAPPAPRAATDDDSGASGVVSEVDTVDDSFALVIGGGTVIFTYDETDNFVGDVSTFAAFEGVLSDGDTVTVDPYSTTGVSTFDLSNDDD